MKVGNFLYINAKCVQNRYMPERIDFVINQIELLQDIKEKAINSLKICMPVTMLDKEFVDDIDTMTRTEGNVTLKFEFTEGLNKVDLTSGERRINVTQELVNYLKSKESVELMFNK